MGVSSRATLPNCRTKRVLHEYPAKIVPRKTVLLTRVFGYVGCILFFFAAGNKMLQHLLARVRFGQLHHWEKATPLHNTAFISERSKLSFLSSDTQYVSWLVLSRLSQHTFSLGLN